MSNFCDFCKCDGCKNGEWYLSHAETEDHRWICDVCFSYELCLDARGEDLSIDAPCKDKGCIHRPKIISEWINYVDPIAV
jgi:hypothetical protein